MVKRAEVGCAATVAFFLGLGQILVSRFDGSRDELIGGCVLLATATASPFFADRLR